MKKLISNLPTATFSKDNWHYLDNLKLADPQFNISGPVDLLLGADIYSELILSGIMKSEQSDYPVAQQTRVGWILCGKVKTFSCFVTLNDIDNLSHFWETEDIAESQNCPSEKEFFANHYTKTTTRLQDGKYVVEMPMKPNYETCLGDTKKQAIAQFLQLEGKMRNNEKLEMGYKDFINEYIAMGHMKPVSVNTSSNKQLFLSHHGIVRAESSTTKFRVVFNGSSKNARATALTTSCLPALTYKRTC